MDLPAPLGPSNPTAFPVPETPRRQVIPWRISRRPSLTFRFSSSTTGVSMLQSRGFAPRTPLHALSRAASSARSVAWLASLARVLSSQALALAVASPSTRSAKAPCRRPSFSVGPSLARDGVGLLSQGRPAQALDQHHVHDQSGDASTAGGMDLFRRSIEHDENRIAPGHELAERRVRGQRRQDSECPLRVQPARRRTGGVRQTRGAGRGTPATRRAGSRRSGSRWHAPRRRDRRPPPCSPDRTSR